MDVYNAEMIVKKYEKKLSSLIPVLLDIQKQYNFLPREILKALPEMMNVTAAEVEGVSTFYPQFRLEPAGRHSVEVCIGTACHVKGANDVTRAFRRHLNIPDDSDTDPELMFTVREVACLGCCMLAPAVRIDETIYGYAEPGKIADILADFLKEQAARPPDSPTEKNHEPAGEFRICLCSSCTAGGSAKIADAARKSIAEFSFPVTIKTVACTGISYETPLVELVTHDGTAYRYGRVSQEQVRTLLARHFSPASLTASLKNKAVSILDRLLAGKKTEPKPVTRFTPDTRQAHSCSETNKPLEIITEYAGKISPLDIDEYIENNGFEALKKAIDGKSNPIEELKISGLRGRGGAGFPTWKKWDAVGKEISTKKYIICNGDEGDPGAFMDRMVLESFPFRVIEGILIAAYAVGADTGILYIRSEYPLALARIRQALEICELRGFLGKNICSSDFSFNLTTAEGAGAFVCGEETALTASLEGGRGIPKVRPPFPSKKGLNGKPTLINNVETFASVPWIILNGSAKFAENGTKTSRGTKTFALAGKIRNGGLIEVPMGITLSEIIFDIGGGVPDGKKAKAVQIGGPSGGCIPAELFDMPVDFEALQDAGAIMGSGGLVLLDEDDCMVDIARYFMQFVQNESCGKCTFCRIGTKRMLEILKALCRGTAERSDLDELESLGESVARGSLCGLGRTAPNPVLSAIRHFKDEFTAHTQGICPAGKCRELTRYFITTDCIGCTICAQNCPVDAIASVPHERHIINTEACIACGTCFAGCPRRAVKKGKK